MSSTSGTHLSREFFELIKAIGESRSKQEEDRIIAREVLTLKNKLNPWKKQGSNLSATSGGGGSSSQNLNFSTKKKQKEFLVRLLYVEMLGHDASFGYVKATELAASPNIFQKRVGYLVCGACLSPEHEFRFMLVNQMQRDLNSSNVLENCAALLAVTRVITADMVPAVCGDVSKLLTHASETVRKKAIIALHRLFQLNSDAVPMADFIDKLRRALCDRDPAVMGASLCVIESMATHDAAPFKDLVPSLVSILKQIIEHRLPSDFDYHRMPAPWMQMAILRILAILAVGDAHASSECYEVISDCLSRADVGANSGYAVVYECIRTITKIYPNPVLLDAAAESISRFIASRSHNLKYLGVTGLASIVEQHPKYAAIHQLAVVECLEDRDETLQRKTLELLYKMTNPVNVEFITDKLLSFLEATTDLFLKRDLTNKIGTIAERYAPNQEWYIRSITKLFEISGEMVSPQIAHNLMTMIAEGEEDESEENNMSLRKDAVELYASLLEHSTGKNMPKVLADTVAWVLGEYAYLSTEYSIPEILEYLCNFAKRRGPFALTSTRRFLISAVMKLVAQLGTCPPCAAFVIDEFSKSSDTDLQQRCLEFQNLLTNASNILGAVLPVDASCEDIDANESLSELDWFVAEARANGAQPYNRPDDEEDDSEYVSGRGRVKPVKINITPYEKPKDPREYKVDLSRQVPRPTPSQGSIYERPSHVPTSPGGFATLQPESAPPISEPSLNVRNVAHVWGKPAPAPTSMTVVPIVESSQPPPPKPSQGGYGGWNQKSSETTTAAVQQTKRELTEKEKLAAALFGGIVPGASAPPAGSTISTRTHRARPEKQTPTPLPQVSAAVTALPEVDLLDFSFGETSAVPSSEPVVDILAPTPVSVEAPPPSVQPHKPATLPDDPFAASGLLKELSDAPLSPPPANVKFEYNGTVVCPLQINTQQFGNSWSGCTATHPVSVVTTAVSSLDALMDLVVKAGFHKVETIAVTSEGISAGMIGGSVTLLIHGKFTAQRSGGAKIDLTVKSNDSNVGGSLATYLATIMR